mmetsp:Transcript_57071/g.149510  ORF Transcript_57071/g.149510 Transcript_57071/m.149510 type:complete len:258 (+) Transcript_57071:451-1224(+)
MVTLTLSPCTSKILTCTLSPSLYSASGLAKPRVEHSTSLDAPTSMKMPNLLLLVMVPSIMLPTFMPEVVSFCVTRILRSAGVEPACSSKILRSGMVSPTLYFLESAGSCNFGHKASFSAPMLIQMPMLAMRETLPSNVSPTFRSSSFVPVAWRRTACARAREAPSSAVPKRPAANTAANPEPEEALALAAATGAVRPSGLQLPRSAPPDVGSGATKLSAAPSLPLERARASNSVADARAASATAVPRVRRWRPGTAG